MWNVWLTKFRDLWGLVDPLQWHGYLFHYGVPSVCLCSGVAKLAHHLASGNADCELFYLYSDDSWGVYNLVDHVAALWNARVLWLCCFHFLFNFYWQ